MFLKIIVLCPLFGFLLAQVGSKGRHFIVTVPPIFRIDRETNCTLYITSNDNGEVFVRTHINNSITTIGHYVMTAGVLQVDLEGNEIYQSSSGIHTKAIEIKTNIDVAVYVGLHQQSVASFTAFPTSALSMSYGIISYQPNTGKYNYVQVTSIENDTHVTVENFRESTQTAILQFMETFTVKTPEDSSGATIESNKPVNVISGCMCSNVPENIRYCDPIYDSPLPKVVWGNHFIIPPMIPRTGFIVRILAETKQTSIFLTYATTGIIQRSVRFEGMYELQLGTNTTVVTTDKRVTVMQYAVGQYFDQTDGDPFMTTVPSIKHFSKDYIFPSLFDEWKFVIRIAVTIESRYLNELELDGRNIDSPGNNTVLSVPAPYSHYSVVIIHLLEGKHTLKHPSPAVKFSAFYYGFDHHHGHGLYLGYSFGIRGCGSSPCQNKGSCTDNINGHTCFCEKGYTGDNCEIDIDECSPNPCHNEGNCTDGINFYNCTCLLGFYGVNCENVTNVSDLDSETAETDSNFTVIGLIVGAVIAAVILSVGVVFIMKWKGLSVFNGRDTSSRVEEDHVSAVYTNTVEVDVEHTSENWSSRSECVETAEEHYAKLSQSSRNESNNYDTLR